MQNEKIVMKEHQTSLNRVEAETDYEKYRHWIVTVGDLREALKLKSDDTLVKLDFVGQTTMGDVVNVNMYIGSIGNSKVKVDGKWRNLVYLNGTKY